MTSENPTSSKSTKPWSKTAQLEARVVVLEATLASLMKVVGNRKNSLTLEEYTLLFHPELVGKEA